MNALLLAALIAVESGGNNLAVGDGGLAVGCLQIHPCVVADVNRIVKARGVPPYTLADRLDREKSKQICVIYLDHYASAKRIGVAETTDEIVARCWNGGPRGYKNPATLNYWQKVKREMERQRRTAPKLYQR